MRVCAFESRRGGDMASLIKRHGGEATVVPTMRESPLESNVDAFEFGDRLLRGEIDAVVFMTGVGATALREVLETRIDPAELQQALNRCLVAVRGPKPTAVLAKWNIHIDVRAPEPNTWRELLAALDEAGWKFASTRIALQEYGAPSLEFTNALRDRGAAVLSVNVYRWELPENLAPLREAIQGMIDGRFDVLLITSAQQVRHAVYVADGMGLKSEWLRAANNCIVGSIGPTASETLREFGLELDLEPSHPKMGHLVMETLQSYLALRDRKRQHAG